MSIDFPRAWQIVEASDIDEHDRRCSYRTHRMLCDCSVLMAHPEQTSKTTFYGKDGKIIRTYEVEE